MSNSVEGLLLRDRFDLRETEVMTVWRLGKAGWETVDFSPPFEIAPANTEPEWEEGSTSWHFPCVLVGPDGNIFTVNQSGGSPGTRIVGRWADGKATRIGIEFSYNYSSDSFITPDGMLWNDSLGRLLRFQDGKFEVVAGNPYDPVRLEPIRGEPGHPRESQTDCVERSPLDPPRPLAQGPLAARGWGRRQEDDARQTDARRGRRRIEDPRRDSLGRRPVAARDQRGVANL